jgi:hypothetical protein
MEKNDESNILTTIYRFKTREPVPGVSFSHYGIYKSDEVLETTHIYIRPPAEVQISDPPLDYNDGRFRIKCPDMYDPELMHYSTEFKMDTWEGSIDNTLQFRVPHFWFNIRVTKPRYVNDWTTGFTLFIHMYDIEAPVPLCEIESGEDHPMLEGVATFSSEKIQEYGKNLRFDPIPMEMLYTPAYKPQVLVKVNGLDAVCPDLNCDFTYFEADDVPSVVGA